MVKDGKPVFSYSQLSNFETCPYGWKLLYVDHVPRDDNCFSLYGSIVHGLLEKYAKGELELDALEDLFECEFGSITEPWPPNKYVDLEESYKNKGLAFFRTFEGLDNVEILGVEKHFYIDRGFYWLQGYIDLIYKTKDGKLVCRDWKSTKAYTKQQLAEHQRQVYLYSAPCIEWYGKPPDELEFYHFRDEKKRSRIRFNETDYHEALWWADDKAEALLNAWSYPHHYDDWFCNQLCSARTNCEYREKERKKLYAKRD